MNVLAEEKNVTQNSNLTEDKIKNIVENACKQAMDESLKAFKEKDACKPEKVSLWKKIHYIFMYFVILASVGAGLLNWNKEIISAQIAEIQAQKNEKIKLQEEFNKAVFNTRVLVLNQNTLCKVQHRFPEELKVERLNSLKNVIVLNSKIRNMYGFQASNIVSDIVSNIYDIVDICSLNGDGNDHTLQGLFQKINIIIYASIAENNKDLNKLIIKRHQLELPKV